MGWVGPRAYGTLLALAASVALGGCNRAAPHADHPQMAPGVVLRDVTFESASLHRSMPYRVMLPANVSPGQRLPVVYLLHGRDDDFRSWSNAAPVSRLAARGYLLVMPEGYYTYYANSATFARDRYEDYITADLVRDVESRFPAADSGPTARRAIVGVSMGGVAAIALAFHHPAEYGFAGALSPALDVPSRPFLVKRFTQSVTFLKIFGPLGSATRMAYDPFRQAAVADPGTLPFVWFSCGDEEPLLAPSQRFAALLAARHIAFVFHPASGAHNWSQWSGQLPLLLAALTEHVPASPPVRPAP